ncbi:AraC family transcriptional regulator [Aliamphritea hakodatensis]|uniref:AraC family transcriptional regulator n=1 Tax=Aliamphritea hakodatensis TaxID=2895352 RepID=UPI0022FD7D4F|nr:AraC family transcriptional regulator [Aliamphritea hakodatensis]
MDRLSSLLQTFTPTARQIGMLEYGPHGMLLPEGSNILFLNQGQLSIDEAPETDIRCGDLLWITQDEYRTLSSQSEDLQLLCCNMDFGPSQLNPVFDKLPPVVQIHADDQARETLNPTLQLLLLESMQHRCGHETVLNRLAEVLLVHMLRFLMKHQLLEYGVIAGLSDIRLARAITAMHSQPEQRWSVETLANEAGMSRTAFNQHFRDTVGCPPGEYLTRWRMRLACQLLENNHLSIGQIVDQLGYLSDTAFFRAFRKAVGVSPGQYRQQALMQQSGSA